MKAFFVVLGRFIGGLIVAVGVVAMGAFIWYLPRWDWEYGLSIHLFSGTLLLYLSVLCLGCIILYYCRGRITRNRVEWYQIEQINDPFQVGNDDTSWPTSIRLPCMAIGGLTLGLAVIASLYNEFIVPGDMTISDAEYYSSMWALRGLVGLASICGGTLLFAMRENK